jgi:hypothetical protein
MEEAWTNHRNRQFGLNSGQISGVKTKFGLGGNAVAGSAFLPDSGGSLSDVQRMY